MEWWKSIRRCSTPPTELTFMRFFVGGWCRPVALTLVWLAPNTLLIERELAPIIPKPLRLSAWNSHNERFWWISWQKHEKSYIIFRWPVLFGEMKAPKYYAAKSFQSSMCDLYRGSSFFLTYPIQAKQYYRYLYKYKSNECNGCGTSKNGINAPFSSSKYNSLPGKQVAVNFHQLYPSHLPKKMVLSYVFQVPWFVFLIFFEHFLTPKKPIPPTKTEDLQFPLPSSIGRHTLPETNIAPENGWLEKQFPFGMAEFQVRKC